MAKAGSGEPKKMGRPKRVPLVDPVIAGEVCAWIAEGKTLRDFCRQPGKPCRATIDAWRQQDDEFASRVARARDIGYDMIAEECAAIADTQEFGETITDGDDGRKVVTGDMLGHRKLRVETRLKLLACWDPRRYGQKAQVEHAGGISVQVVTGVPPQDAVEFADRGDDAT